MIRQAEKHLEHHPRVQEQQTETRNTIGTQTGNNRDVEMKKTLQDGSSGDSPVDASGGESSASGSGAMSRRSTEDEEGE